MAWDASSQVGTESLPALADPGSSAPSLKGVFEKRHPLVEVVFDESTHFSTQLGQITKRCTVRVWESATARSGPPWSATGTGALGGDRPDGSPLSTEGDVRVWT